LGRNFNHDRNMFVTENCVHTRSINISRKLRVLCMISETIQRSYISTLKYANVFFRSASAFTAARLFVLGCLQKRRLDICHYIVHYILYIIYFKDANGW